MSDKPCVAARLSFATLQAGLALMIAACGAAATVPPQAHGLAGQPNSPQARALAKLDKALDFALPEAQGRLVRLADLLQAHQAIVLVYYNSLYCRQCLDLLTELEQHRLQFEQGGAQLVAVAHQSMGDAADTRTVAGAHYPVLADRDRRLAKLYGVPPFLPGRPKHGNMPVTVYIIGQDGHIVWNSTTDSATTWPTSEVILANLPSAVSRQ